MEDQEPYEVKHKNSFEIYISKLKEKSRMKVYGLQEQLSLSKGTWYKRLKKPTDLTIEEIIKLSEIFDVEEDEIFQKVLSFNKKQKKNRV